MFHRVVIRAIDWAATVGDEVDTDEHYPLHSSGSASTLPAQGEDSVIAALHAVVKEVTGRDVEQPAKARIGFLP